MSLTENKRKTLERFFMYYDISSTLFSLGKERVMQHKSPDVHEAISQLCVDV